MSSSFLKQNLKSKKLILYYVLGMYVDSVSNGFTIDITPPEAVSLLLSRDTGSILHNTIIFRSNFKVIWACNDRESSIEKQYLSIKAHRGAEFKLAATKVWKRKYRIKLIGIQCLL